MWKWTSEMRRVTMHKSACFYVRVVTRLISDVHFHITGPKLTFKTYNYRHCDTSMSSKTADYFPSGGVIATSLGNCKVLCYANMNVTLFRGISQSNFCIFHNTSESVIISRWIVATSVPQEDVVYIAVGNVDLFHEKINKSEFRIRCTDDQVLEKDLGDSQF